MYVKECFPAVADFELAGLIVNICRQLGYAHHIGITRSHDSFYIDHEQDVIKTWSSMGVLASDMETAALFTLASLRGVRAASILNNVVIFGEDVKGGIGEYVDKISATAAGEKREIEVALKAITRLEVV